MDTTVERLAKAVNLIRKSLTCSVCLEVCSDPCTTRCGHPFCQQCIATVMVKRGAQCPMCNGSLTRRTVRRDDLFANMITRFHKIEEAIKADIHIDIAAYQIHPESKEASGGNTSNLFPKTYLPARGSSKRNNPRVISNTKLSSTNSILNYINIKQQSKPPSIVNQTNKKLDSEADSTMALAESVSKNTNLHLNKNTSAEETPKPKRRGKIKSTQTRKTRRKTQKSSNDKGLIFNEVNRTIRERNKVVASTSFDCEQATEDSLCLHEIEKTSDFQAPVEVTKKTWTRVKKFGREMRPLKKKSLNVSIESKSPNTPSCSNQNIICTEIDSQDIFATSLDKNSSNLDHSLSEMKEEDKDLISRLSSKEVNDIIGVIPEAASETGPFTPQNIINVPSAVENLPKNLDDFNHSSSEKSESMTEYFKGFQNENCKAQRIVSNNTLEDSKSPDEPIIQNSNSEDERNENILKNPLLAHSSGEIKSYKSSPEVPQMTLNPVRIPITTEFPVEQMDFTLPVNCVESNRKSDESKHLSQETSHGSINKDTRMAAKELSNLSQKEIHHGNVRSSFGEKNFECRTQNNSLISKSNNFDQATKFSEMSKTFVPFKKLGRIFKKQRRIPFYYLGQLCNNHNFFEKSNLTMLSPTSWEKKNLKRNFSITNLSDSGFSRTRGNLTPETSKLNNNEQGVQRTSSGRVILLSPQNDSQLRHLSIGSPNKSPHKEGGEIPILQSSAITSRKDNLENIVSSMSLRRESSSSNIEKQKNFKTPQSRKNIAKQFESLAGECEKSNKEEELIVEKEVERQDLYETDFEIDTAQFNEFVGVAEFIPKRPSEEEMADKRKEEPKHLQDTDTGSVIPSSLDRPSNKFNTTSDNLSKPKPFLRSPNSKESLHRHFEHTGTSQRNPQSLQQIESQDIADRFFEDVIEKSKHIRANTSVDNVKVDDLNEVNIEPKINFLKSKSNDLANKFENPSNSIEIMKSLIETEIVKLLRDNVAVNIEDNVKDMQVDPNSGLNSLHVNDKVNINFQNEDTQNSGSDKENTIQNMNQVESSSQLFTHNVQSSQTLPTSFLKKPENFEAKKSDLRNSENDVSEVYKTSASKSSPTCDPCVINKKISDEKILNASKNKANVILADSLMNITEEQLMLNEFEKELFEGAKQVRENEDVLPDDLKTPTTSSARAANTDMRSENNLVVESPEEDDVDIIESTPKSNRSIPEKVISDNCSDFSPISVIGSQSDKVSKLFAQPSVKRKSCPLYHSTPKVPRTTSPRCGASLNSDILLSSLQKPEPSSEGNIQVLTKPKLTFVCSGLSISQIDTVKQLAKLVNADFTSSFNPNVTHVIVKVTGPKNAAEKTLKFVQGIAHRKWIVSIKWALDSLHESMLLNEENYEAVENLTLEEGPKKSRLRTRGIFDDFLCMCKGPFNNVSVEEYWDLLTHTGATIVYTMNSLAVEQKKLKILIVQADQWDHKIIMEWFQKTKAVPIAHEWIVECISQYKLVSIPEYLQTITPQEVSALGFPEELLLEEGSDCEYED